MLPNSTSLFSRYRNRIPLVGATVFLVAAFVSHGQDEIEKVTEAEAEPVEASEEVLSGPSRFAGAYAESYIEAHAAKFSMRDRDLGPFGLLQDPTAEPPKPKVAVNGSRTRTAALPATPLSDMIRLIRVNTVMPRERKFLIGTRSFSENDQFPMIYQGKEVPVKIVEVSSSRIKFMNAETKEEAVLELGLLPSGMVAGGGSLKPPGMVVQSANRPLTLESSAGPDAQN